MFSFVKQIRTFSPCVVPSTLNVRKIVSDVPTQNIPQESPGLFASLKYRLGFGVNYPTRKLKASGQNLYVVCAEYPDIKDFIKRLNLPDTFQTWFSLTTLHIWMCLVRLRREGEEGRILKDSFIKLIWPDLRGRMRPFGIVRKQHDQIEQFKMQFFGSLFAYDEAFMMNKDSALAAALWRNLFFSNPETSAHQLDLALQYTRKQLAHLDSLPSSQVLGKGMPTFLGLNEDRLNPEYANRRLYHCFTWPGSGK